jgi:hypothetical protein
MRRLLLALVLIALPHVAAASTVFQVASGSGSLSFDRFDAALGTLTQVDLVLLRTTPVGFTMFPGPEPTLPTTATFSLGGLSIISAGAAPPAVDVYTVSGHTIPLLQGGYGGVVSMTMNWRFSAVTDLIGFAIDVEVPAPNLLIFSPVVQDIALTLADFTGPGQMTWADSLLPSAAGQAVFLPGATSLIAQVTYTYDAATVPLPATALLLGGALAGFGALGRRRARKAA